MKRKNTVPVKPVRVAQVPVTVQMLNEMEGRLVYKFESRLHQSQGEAKTEFRGVRTEIAGIRSDITRMDTKFSGMEVKFSGMEANIEFIKSDVAEIKSELHRVALLVEEQKAQNRFVLDGYSQLYELIQSRLG